MFRTFKRENTDYFRWICCMRRPTEVFYQTNLVFLSAQFSFLLEYSSTVSCWCMSVRLAEYDAVEALQVQGNREVLSHDGSIHLLQLRKNIFQTRTHQFSWKTPLPRHPKMWGCSLFLIYRKQFELTFTASVVCKKLVKEWKIILLPLVTIDKRKVFNQLTFPLMSCK